jgi:hypothetical protein
MDSPEGIRVNAHCPRVTGIILSILVCIDSSMQIRIEKRSLAYKNPSLQNPIHIF